MSKFFSAKIYFLFSILLCFSSTNLFAQKNDRLYIFDTKSPKSGTVMSSSKGGITFKSGSNQANYAAGTIEKILFAGDPGPLTKARESALDGQYEQALDELKSVQIDKLGREVIKQEALFFRIYCDAKLALQGRGDKATAVKNARTFVSTQPNTWHFYEVAELLGDLAIALGDTKNARTFYGALQGAPTPEAKIRAMYLLSIADLKDDDNPSAQSGFEKVMGVKAATPGTVRLVTLATAGKAVALARSGKGAEGLKIVDSLVADLNPNDVELAARIYNAQGACYLASGDKEGAILAFLHTHLLFSTQPDAHAECLTQLVELFPQVGKPGRAAELRQELKDRYPGFGK